MNWLPIDELNKVSRKLKKTDLQANADGIKEDILDFLIETYLLGVEASGEMLGIKNPSVSNNDMQKSLYREYDGKTWEDRIDEYCESNDLESVLRVVDTEMHRNYNEAVFNVGKSNGATSKTWMTMLDDKVREPHEWLEGVKVGIDERFYVGEDSAMYPGDFADASLNVNCRCYLELSKD